jgi:probable phosphomutase (TIGR03848 family)
MRLLLVRHAMCDPVGKSLAGRAPGVCLNDEGRAEAAALARFLGAMPVAAVYSSPLERARETATAIAEVHAVDVREEPALNEIDFGAWTGRSLEELAPLEDWREWNEHRSTARIPQGESMVEVQQRACAAIEAIRWRHPQRTVVVVTHADVAKSLIAGYLGLSLDNLALLEIAPASVSTIDVEEDWVRVDSINVRARQITDCA